MRPHAERLIWTEMDENGELHPTVVVPDADDWDQQLPPMPAPLQVGYAEGACGTKEKKIPEKRKLGFETPNK